MTLMVCGVSSTAIASFSSKFLEMPVRTSGWMAVRPRQVALVGAGASALLAALVVPQLGSVADRALLPTSAAALSAAAAGISDADLVAVKSDGGKAPQCLGSPIRDCIVTQGGPRTRRVLLVGDSHARSLVPAVTAIAKDRGWTLAVATGSGCPWHWGLLYPRAWGEQTDACRDTQNDWYRRLVPEFRPDIALLATYSFTDPVGTEVTRPADHSEQGLSQASLIDRAARRSVAALRETGAAVVLIDPLSVSTNGNPMTCLSKGRAIADCAFTVTGEQIPAERLYAKLAEPPSVVQVDLDGLACPRLPRCDSVIDGQVVRRDHNHVSASFWLRHKAELAQRLAVDGS